MYLMAIDLGTSLVKVLIMSPEGEVVARASAAYPIHSPNAGWAEQNPEEWWSAVAGAVRLSLADFNRRPSDIAGIGFSGQMHGTVLLDAESRHLGPAIIWADQRSGKQAREIGETMGFERLLTVTGSRVVSGFQAATLLWLQQNQPELWARAAAILTPKDTLRLRMTGEIWSEPSDASGTALFDVHQSQWSEELVGLLSITRNQLPPIISSSGSAGLLLPSAASDLGLSPGTRVICGSADTAAGILGAGIVAERTALVTLSTGGQVAVLQRQWKVDPKGRTHTFCSATSSQPELPRWYLLAATLSAGLSLTWLKEQILRLDDDLGYEKLSAWADKSPPGANGLIFLPHLVGERTPHMDPQARGLLLGLTARHSQEDLVRAVMEGVVFALYDAFTVLTRLGLQPEGIIMAGGGARNALWCQIVADVFDLPVRRLLTYDHSAIGAALLSGTSLGVFELEEAAAAWACYGPPIHPDPERMCQYREYYEVFREVYALNRDFFHKLNRLED